MHLCVTLQPGLFDPPFSSKSVPSQLSNGSFSIVLSAFLLNKNPLEFGIFIITFYYLPYIFVASCPKHCASLLSASTCHNACSVSTVCAMCLASRDCCSLLAPASRIVVTASLFSSFDSKSASTVKKIQLNHTNFVFINAKFINISRVHSTRK